MLAANELGEAAAMKQQKGIARRVGCSVFRNCLCAVQLTSAEKVLQVYILAA